MKSVDKHIVHFKNPFDSTWLSSDSGRVLCRLDVNVADDGGDRREVRVARRRVRHVDADEQGPTT
jgi:hypothetical protein